MTPWQLALEIPSHHGLAADTFAHLCGGQPGAYVLSGPDFLLLASDAALPKWFRDDPASIAGRGYAERLSNPYARFTDEGCNCWRIGVLAGDMVAAYRALVSIGGERPYLCWQDRGNRYRWRKAGPAFDRLLSSIQCRRKSRPSNSESLFSSPPSTKTDRMDAGYGSGQ